METTTPPSSGHDECSKASSDSQDAVRAHQVRTESTSQQLADLQRLFNELDKKLGDRLNDQMRQGASSSGRSVRWACNGEDDRSRKAALQTK